MSSNSRLSPEIGRSVATSFDALAYRLERRAGTGPDGTAHWFTLTPAQLKERAPALRRLASRLESVHSSGELEGMLLVARSALQDLLGTAREYTVPRSVKPRRLLWLFDEGTSTPIDANPNEVGWALRDVNRALLQVAPTLARLIATA